MHPVTETRYTLLRYIVLWCFIAAAHAVAFGIASALPAEVAALDGALFGAVSGFIGMILWNVLRYGTVGTPTAKLLRIGMFSLVTVVGILFVAVVVGAECLAVWAALDMLPPAFVTMIPARCLITAAVYVCYALWYSSVARSELEHPRRISADGGNDRGEFFSDAEMPANHGVNAEKPLEKLPEPAEPLERITVRGTGGRIEVIGVEEVVYLQAEGDYVAIVTPSGRWLKEGTMKYFEEALPRGKFVRVHRSYIVAVGCISRIETSGRDHTLILRGGGGNARGSGSIRISDAGYRLLKRTLGL